MRPLFLSSLHTLCILFACLGTGCSQPTAESTPAPSPSDRKTEVASGESLTSEALDSASIPTGWKHVAGKEIPAVSKSTPELPTTVTSDDGVEVSVRDTSRTIVGNDDIIAVMDALGLGDQVFAAPTSTVTESGRKAPHHFLFNRTTGIEGILALDGTLFVGNSLRRHGKLAQPLRDAGMAMVIIDELQDAPEKVRKTAAVFGYAQAGEELAKKLQEQLTRAEEIAASHDRKPRAVVLSSTGGGGTPTVAGADTAAAKMIRLAGGVNIGDESKVADYSQLSSEGIMAAAPEVILLCEGDLKAFGGEDGVWKAYPTLKETPAGVANRVWVLPDLQLKVSSIASGSGAIALAEAFSKLASELSP